MKQRGVFLIGVILMAVYYFLFPRGTGKELVIVPRAYTSLSSAEATGLSPSDDVFSVKSGSTAAYFSDDFRLAARYGSARMAVDDQWLVLPGETGLDLLDPDGRLRARLPGNAVPVARNGALYLYRTDQGRLSRIDPANGAVLWSRDLLSVVTVLDYAAGRTLVGLLDGRCLVIDQSGEVVLRYRPGGSRVEAIYGGALSDDGTALALVAGLDPQRFVLLEERKNGFRPVSHHDTGTDFRRYLPVGFVNKGERVLYEGENSVVAVDTEEYGLTRLDLKGRPVSWRDDSLTGSLSLLGRQESRTVLRILSRSDLTLMESPLPEDTSSLRMSEDNLMLVGEQFFAVLGLEVR